MRGGERVGDLAVSDLKERVFDRVACIAIYSAAAFVMGRYGMPWYASLGVLLAVILASHIGPQPKDGEL